MRKFAIRGFLLIVLLALLAGGAYGLYWYQVKSFVDQAVEQALPQARVEYGSIYAHPLGEVGVDHVVITLTRDGTRIPIRSIRVRSQDPLFFFDPQGRIESGDWPPLLNFALQGVEMSLSSPLLKVLESQDAQMARTLPGGISLNALACGEHTNLGLDALRAMGYRQMMMDTSVQLQVMSAEGRLRLDTDFDVADMGDGYASIEISVSGNDLAPAQLLAANPRLRRLEINYQDAGYNARRNRYCAEQAGTDVEQYLTEHETLANAWLLAQGVALPAPLQEIYHGLNLPQGQFGLVIDPPGGLGAEVMASLNAPAALIERLNLSVQLNGKTVALDDIRWSDMLGEPRPEVLARALSGDEADESEVSEEMASESESALQSAAPQSQAPDLTALVESVAAESAPELESALEHDLLRGMPTRRVMAEEKRYRPIPLTQVNELAGMPVRVRTDLGNLLEGRVVEVGQRTLKLEQRIDRGLMVYPLTFEQIRTIEVYR